jgi:DNA-binding GntR family transcriptional regulator
VTLVTLRQALQQLEDDGLLSQQPGRGTFVAEPRAAYRLDSLRGFAEDLRAQGQTVSTQILGQAVHRPPAWVTAFRDGPSSPGGTRSPGGSGSGSGTQGSSGFHGSGFGSGNGVDDGAAVSGGSDLGAAGGFSVGATGSYGGGSHSAGGSQADSGSHGTRGSHADSGVSGHSGVSADSGDSGVGFHGRAGRFLRLERLRLIAGRPAVHQLSWIRGDDLAEADLSGTSLYAALADLGIVVHRATESVRPGVLDGATAGLLGQPEGTPVFVSDRVTYGLDGTPIVFDRATILGSALEIRTERAATGLSMQWSRAFS